MGDFVRGELVVQCAVCGDEGTGAADDEGDFVVAIFLFGEENDAGEGAAVVLDGGERVIESAGDLVGFEASEEESHGLNAVGLPGTDVLLLAARRNFDATFAEDADIANDGADAAIEEAVGEIFVAEQAT